jgi:photosystem II stability/assembly factor-like uncharacterized protein
MQKILLFGILIFAGLACRKDAGNHDNWTKIPFFEFPETSEKNMTMVADHIIVEGSTIYLAGSRDFHESYPFIARSTDNGFTWTILAAPPNGGAGTPVESCFFVSETEGFMSTICMGNHKIYRTTSGGTTWNTVYNSTSVNIYPVNDIGCKIDDSTFIIKGIKSIDGGQTWQPITWISGTTAYYFKDATYGLCATGNGIIAQTDDLGMTWDTIYNDPAKDFLSITMPDAQTILAGGSVIIRSIDKGTNWTTVYAVPQVHDIKFVDANIGFAATVNGFGPSADYWALALYNGDILKTTDGGQTWSVNYHSDFMGFLTLTVINDQTIMAAGQQTDNDASYQKIYYLKTTTQGN